MPVTHSPGNPFAFSPAVPRGPAYDDPSIAGFKHYRSPQTPKKAQQEADSDEIQRLQYQFTEYKEGVAREGLIKEARVEELERLLLDEGKKAERTESDKRFLFDLQTKQAAELDSLRAELAKVKAATDATVRELRDGNNELKEQLITSEESFRAQRQRQERELDHLESSLNSQRRAMDTLKADLTTKNDMLAEKNAKISELERRCEQALVKPDGNPEDLAFVTKELAVALSKVTSLETANASQIAKIHRLQETNAKLSVVSEEKLSLEHKLKLMEATRTELAEAQVRLIELEKERAAWAELVEDGEDLDLAAIITKQKARADTADSQLRLIEEQLNDSNVLVSSLRNDLRGLQGQLEGVRVELTNEKRAHARLERSKTMATREIEFLREQLKSYDLEEQMESPNFDAQKDARIAALERTIDEYRAQLTQTTEQEENKVVVGIKRPRGEESDFNEIERGEYLRKIRGLNAELEITKREDVLLRQELDALRAAQKNLTTTTTTTNSTSTTGRVLQYRDNPTARYQTIRTQTLDDLRTENAALLSELSSKGGSVVTVPIQSLRNAESEYRALEASMRQKEKMILRLKEVFAAKSSEFREAVYSLLGYKLDFLPNGRVRLTSMYAEKTDHAFIFDGEAGTMQLSGDEGEGSRAFMQDVGNLIKFWSGEKNSIPGMLSALTLELLEKEGSSQGIQ